MQKDGWIVDQTRNRVAWLAEGRGGAEARRGKRRTGVKANVPLGSERCSERAGLGERGGLKRSERRSGTQGERPRGQPVREFMAPDRLANALAGSHPAQSASEPRAKGPAAPCSRKFSNNTALRERASSR